MLKFAGTRPTNLGVRDGQLLPCPNTPNCVCSQSQEAEHKIAPLSYSSAPDQAMETLKRVVLSFPKSQVITESEDYLHAEFSSALMGFVDDVEFYLDRAANVIQVRSAARLGKSDLGVNRKRVEQIRAKLETQ